MARGEKYWQPALTELSCFRYLDGHAAMSSWGRFWTQQTAKDLMHRLEAL